MKFKMVSFVVAIILCLPLANSLVELLGIPQPYAIFIDLLIPMPGPSSPFMTAVLLMYELETYNLDINKCPKLNDMNDPVVSDSIQLMDAYQSLMNGNGKCGGFNKNKVCLSSRTKTDSYTIDINISDPVTTESIVDAIRASDTINMTTDMILDYDYVSPDRFKPDRWSGRLEFDVQKGALVNQSQTELGLDGADIQKRLRSITKDDCKKLCQKYGDTCCRWNNRKKAQSGKTNTYCDVFAYPQYKMFDLDNPDLADDDSWLKDDEWQRYSVICTTPYSALEADESESMYKYELANNRTFHGATLVAVERFIGISWCLNGFCNVMSPRIYQSKTDEWYLRILMLGNKVSIVPHIINQGMWATFGVNISQIGSTLVNQSILCGHFNVTTLVDVVSWDSECDSYHHVLNEWLYVLRICDDTSILMQKDEDEIDAVSFYLDSTHSYSLYTVSVWTLICALV